MNCSGYDWLRSFEKASTPLYSGWADRLEPDNVALHWSRRRGGQRRRGGGGQVAIVNRWRAVEAQALDDLKILLISPRRVNRFAGG
jgi:hypothetical protein